jgi:hypothetical protein
MTKSPSEIAVDQVFAAVEREDTKSFSHALEALKASNPTPEIARVC